MTDDGIFNERRERVRLITPNGDMVPATGEFKVQIQVLDAAGNLLDKTVTVINGEQPAETKKP